MQLWNFGIFRNFANFEVFALLGLFMRHLRLWERKKLENGNFSQKFCVGSLHYQAQELISYYLQFMGFLFQQE